LWWGLSGVLANSLDLTDEPHPPFLVQDHILSIVGDALNNEMKFCEKYEVGMLKKSL